MSFAVPMALAFFGLFVPVFLLFLLKQRRRRVQVATLMLWETILKEEHRITSFTRLRKLLSLLIALLIVSWLTLALARPRVSDAITGARRMIVAVDVSAGMLAMENGKTRFEEALREARGAINDLSQGDTLMLLAFSDTCEVLVPFTDNRKTLLDGLRGLEPRHTSTAIEPLVEMLEGLPPDDRTTYAAIVTDGAFDDDIEYTPPEDFSIRYFPVGEAKENVGLTAFEVRPFPGTPQDFELFFRVANYSEEARKVTYEIWLDDALLDAGELALSEGEEEVRTVEQFSEKGGVLRVALESDDAFPLDDTAYAVIAEPDPVEVLLVSEGNAFLEASLGTDSGIELTAITPDEYRNRDEAASVPDVIVFDRWVPGETAPGRHLYIGVWPGSLGLTVDGEINEPLITDWDREHPIHRHVNLLNVSIRSARKVTSHAGFTPLVEAMNDPLVLIRESENRSDIVITFDTIASDLPLRVAFPLICANAIRYLDGVGQDEHWRSAPPGSILDSREGLRRLGDSEGIRAIVAPDGERYPLDEMNYIPIRTVGIYTAEREDGTGLPLIAANLNDRDESNIAPKPGLSFATASAAANSGGLRLGLQPWFLLVGLTYCLLLAEWALFHRRLIE